MKSTATKLAKLIWSTHATTNWNLKDFLNQNKKIVNDYTKKATHLLLNNNETKLIFVLDVCFRWTINLTNQKKNSPKSSIIVNEMKHEHVINQFLNTFIKTFLFAKPTSNFLHLYLTNIKICWNCWKHNFVVRVMQPIKIYFLRIFISRFSPSQNLSKKPPVRISRSQANFLKTYRNY